MNALIARIVLTVAAGVLLSNCAQPAMGGYAIGQRSIAINEARGDRRALTSEARLTQNRRQRANEVEEARAQRELRYHDRDEVLSPLKTVAEAAGLVRSIGFGF